MRYAIIWSQSAEKQLKKLEYPVAKRIYDKVSALAEDPFRNAIRLVGDSGCRIRIGDFRVIYDIQHEKLIVLILKVGHRRDVYD